MKHVVILFLTAIVFCGCQTVELSDIPTYEKNIKTVRYSDGVGYDITLRLCRRVTRTQKYYRTYMSEIEHEMIELVKKEGLYVNQIKYIDDKKFDDTYIVLEASAKPTKVDDWKEYKEHVRIQYLKKILTKAESMECKCRYCTSGLDSKLQY